MKHIFKAIFLIMISFVIAAAYSSCGGGGGGGSGSGSGGGSGISFSTADLQGTWNHLIKGSTIYGVVDLNADGMVTGGSNVEVGAGGSEYTYGDTVSITSSGSVNGSLGSDVPVTAPLRTPGDTHSIISGQMSRDKNLIITAGSTPDEMGLFIKQGTGYSLSNLNGTWSFGSQNGYGTFTVSSVGEVSGSYTALNAPPAGGSVSGNLSITSSGAISGTFNIVDAVNYNVLGGQLSTDKNVLYLALQDSVGEADNAFVAVKKNAEFGIDDLATTAFRLVSFGDDTPVAYGSFTVDSSGAVTGSLSRIGWGSETYQSGTVTINLDGSIVDGEVLTGSNTYTVHWGQVSASKNFSFIVSTVSGTQNGTEIALLVRRP